VKVTCVRRDERLQAEELRIIEKERTIFGPELGTREPLRAATEQQRAARQPR
jgi:hypothetical protein